MGVDLSGVVGGMREHVWLRSVKSASLLHAVNSGHEVVRSNVTLS
jgi:hypothetical protein